MIPRELFLPLIFSSKFCDQPRSFCCSFYDKGINPNLLRARPFGPTSISPNVITSGHGAHSPPTSVTLNFSHKTTLKPIFLFISGPPTNFGLLEKTLARQAKQNRNDGAYSTTYGGSYKQLPKDSFVTTRFSTPRYLSSHLSPHNKIHKEIGLRNVTICTAQEHPPNKLLISVE